ncbi:hypothetical protein SESBI_13943 [Sesbania bispinosa]|nr:hypothetical protein SESBI_13943 [Sesbania bispinosa]
MATTTWFVSCLELTTTTSSRTHHRAESVALSFVWDDEKQFNGVVKCRSEVAQKLLLECESKRGKNSLIRAGYGGRLMYTVASTGDLGFVQQLLERNPLLVFGEGGYNVTDIFYTASRSKNCEVFKMLFDDT